MITEEGNIDRSLLEPYELYVVKAYGFYEEGYMIAVWNGSKFTSSLDWNEDLDSYVEEFWKLK